MDYYVSVVLIAISALLSAAVSLPIFKILQLSGYKTKGLFDYWKATSCDAPIRYAALMLFGFITMIVYIGCFSQFEYARYCAVALYIVFEIVFFFAARKSGSSSVKFTGRIKRLIVADALITLCLATGICFAARESVYCQTLVAALAILAPFTAIAANAVMTPLERANNGKYVKRAKTKLAEKHPIVIGITGSYGKTTAKNLLRAMLAKKYSVMATPGSYNTPMGVCKTINDTLDNEQFLIAELGARHKGDIKELCDIVSPKYGIITAIGDMHIETFRSRSGVADAKFELAEALPESGLIVLNGYNPDCAALAARESACRKLTVGDSERISYSNLEITGDGTSFELVIDGQAYKVKTKLLGSHIAELACVCAGIASECGVSADDIADAVSEASPVEHRLQLVESIDSSVTVIDDAYNSNPIGAKNALDVLGCFNAQKIIVTPGFVELGAIEKECNITLGKQIAGVCDMAFLIGSRAADIKKGAVDGGMSEDSISVFGSRDEATDAFKSLTGDRVILFENDLPDNIK